MSPDAVVDSCKDDPKCEDKPMVCTKTLYNYINRGLLRVINIDLLLKSCLKTKRIRVINNKRILDESIEQRLEEAQAGKSSDTG